MNYPRAGIYAGMASPASACLPVKDDDALLVKAAKAGDSAAFAALIRRHDRRLFKVAQYIVQNAHDAEDVVQDSFLKAFQGLAQFREESKFSTWMIRIVVNHALMKVRQRRNGNHVAVEETNGKGENAMPLEICDVRIDPEQALHAAQVKQRLQRAVKELNPVFRAVFVLRDVQGLSIAETAAALKISVPLVKTRLLRARLRLRQRLSIYFGDAHWPAAGRVAAAKIFRAAV
jgi:RNA polymerase sigma-70 factor, ECF subfamily